MWRGEDGAKLLCHANFAKFEEEIFCLTFVRNNPDDAVQEPSISNSVTLVFV